MDINELPLALEKGTDEIQLISDQLRTFLSSPTESTGETPQSTATIAAETKPQTTSTTTSGTNPSVRPVATQTVISEEPKPDASIQDSACPGSSTAPPVIRSTRTQDKGESGLVRVRTENMNRLMALAGECLVQAQSVKTVYQSLLILKKDIVELEKPLRHSLESQIKDGEAKRKEELQETLTHVTAAEQSVSQNIVRFERFSRRLEHLAHRLYNEVISSRMVPFLMVFTAFPGWSGTWPGRREKQIRFEIAGATTPVDRDILERLEAPLSHVIRNAIDHGLENTCGTQSGRQTCRRNHHPGSTARSGNVEYIAFRRRSGD